MEKNNLFISALDESRNWYRYEHLFADILRHQLEIVSNQQEIFELHRQASQWFEEHGFLDEAVNHTLAVKDWDKSIRLIKDHMAGR